MKKSQKLSLISVSVIVFWLLSIWLFKWDILEIINITFISGLIGLLIGGICLIVSSGFVSLFISGFQKISIGLMSKSNAMERIDTKMKNDTFVQGFKHRIKYWILRVVLLFSTVSIGISILVLSYYYS